MKKLKITENQKKMLETIANAKLKLTEIGIPHSQSPAAKVTGEFKKAKIAGFTAEGVETDTNIDVKWNELVSNVHEFLKQIYTNPTKEGLNPYWETINVTWDELIQMLTAVGIIKSVKGGYRLSKVVESPVKAIKIVAKLVDKMIKDKAIEENMSHSDIKTSLTKQFTQEPKPSGKTRAELLAVIAAKRLESQKLDAERNAKRDSENNQSVVDEDNSNLPAGAEHHPDAPFNQVEPKQGIRPKNYLFKIKWFHQDIAIFEKDGKYYAFNVESADKDEYVEYASREELSADRDEDGMLDIEYGEWEMDGNIVDAYVNDNLKHLSFGKGLNDWENGVEMVEITRDLAEDLINLANYIKGPVGEQLLNILRGVNLEETTTGSVGGSYVGKLEGGPQASYPSNVKDEMTSIIDEVDTDGTIKSEIISSITPFIKHSPDSAIIFWINNEAKLKEIVERIQALGNEEWMLMIQFIISALQGAETYIESKDTNEIDKFQRALSSLTKFVNHFSTYIGEATTTTSAGGDSGSFAYDAPVGDGDKFWTAGNKMNKKSVKENNKAFKDTQYPKGAFVDIDKCAKIGHNDKTAINGGCSTGAVDNVVKTKSTKNSIISDSSIYESVAKTTGKTVEEVKTILKNKINKSN